MTSQISDTIIYKGINYSLIGIDAGELFCPEHFGMEAEMIHTACYRGHYATYELTDDSLILRELTIRSKSGKYLPIGGVEPMKEVEEYSDADEDGFQEISTHKESINTDEIIPFASYSGLDEVVPFSGKIRLANDLIPELYIHMGYQKLTAFKVVLDVKLKNGRVVEIVDRSQEMEQKRGAFKKYYDSGDMTKTIEDAFRLDIDFE